MTAADIRKRLTKFWATIPEPPVEAEPLSRSRKWALIFIIFALAGLVRYLHYLDLAPLIQSGQQDFAGITAIHDGVASNILNKGIAAVFPSQAEWPQPSETSLLQYPPGYGIFL